MSDQSIDWLGRLSQNNV